MNTAPPGPGQAMSHGVAVAGVDEGGGPGELTVGEPVTEGVVAGVPGTVGVVGVGQTAGVAGVALDVGVGVVEGAGVDVVAGGDWTGPTRLGPVLRRPVSSSAIASPTTVPTAPASSGPLSMLVLVSAAAIPAAPRSARTVSAQLARSACHQLVRSLIFGVRRKAAFLANRASTEARATTSEVDCQMKNAPIASRQDAPVLRRSSAIARARPSWTSTGDGGDEEDRQLAEELTAAGGQVRGAGQQEDGEQQAEQVAVPLQRAGQVRPAPAGRQVVLSRLPAGEQRSPVHAPVVAGVPPVAVVLWRLHEPDPRVGEERHAAAEPSGSGLVVGVDDADDLGVRVGEVP